MAQGFTFHLWAYDLAIGPLPPGVLVRDANQVLSEDTIFRYPVGGQIDVAFGVESYAGFSDIFRYKLLHDHGGWYTDMDVTCLKRPDFESEYVFRDHWLLPAVGNIMRCPPRSQLMARSYELAARAVDAMNDDWHKPVRIMCRFIEELGLSGHIRKGICNLDDSAEVEQKFLQANTPFPDGWYFIHWCNAMSRKNFRTASTYHGLLRHFECETI